MTNSSSIAVIGGGIAGTTSALYLGAMGLNVTLFEKGKSLVDGPPFCHLHAGGNLYREISDQQCITLLKQSIDFLRLYPFAIDYRPTVIAIPLEDSGTPGDLLPRLSLLTSVYETLIRKDPSKRVLGDPQDYYRIYARETMEQLAQLQAVERPRSLDEWMIPVARNLDFDRVKFPLIIVQEYGINLFRVAAGVTLALEKTTGTEILMETEVTGIERSIDRKWKIDYTLKGIQNQREFDYIVNAAGFRTGKIDDMAGVACNSMVEFKAAYISHWKECCDSLWPELIFHGERGTPRGMGQFTPYPYGYFQLHGMTKEITLYEDGLVAKDGSSCQPQLKQAFIEKIESEWSNKEINTRTQNAIRYLSQYLPDFITAEIGSKPLYGAQQIPGSDPSLRVAEVSFPAPFYARCEIVKVSSVTDMVEAIIDDLVALKLLDPSISETRKLQLLDTLQESKLESLARSIAASREYPEALAKCTQSFQEK